MGTFEILIILIIILAVFGGGWGYARGGWVGPGPGGLIGLLVVILVIILLFRLLSGVVVVH